MSDMDYSDYGQLLEPDPLYEQMRHDEAELVEHERELLADRLGRDDPCRRTIVRKPE